MSKPRRVFDGVVARLARATDEAKAQKLQSMEQRNREGVAASYSPRTVCPQEQIRRLRVQ